MKLKSNWRFLSYFLRRFIFENRQNVSDDQLWSKFAKSTKIKSRIQSESSHREVFVKSRQNFWKFLWRIFLKILKKELPHRFKGFGHVFQYLLWYPRTPGQREEVQLPEVYSGSLPTSSMKIFVTIVNS